MYNGFSSASRRRRLTSSRSGLVAPAFMAPEINLNGEPSIWLIYPPASVIRIEPAATSHGNKKSVVYASTHPRATAAKFHAAEPNER